MGSIVGKKGNLFIKTPGIRQLFKQQGHYLAIKAFSQLVMFIRSASQVRYPYPAP
jgi:hypothetical protein